jgi:DNA polymerase-3 subunit delta
MKIQPKNADSFARRPDPAMRAILVYGPDHGLVRERVGKIVASVVEDPNDPFRVAELSGAQVAKDPALVADEAAAMAFGGGRRVVLVQGADDGVTKALSQFLADPVGDGLVVVEAGDLESKSKLRQMFDKASVGATIACYRDDARSLPGIIQDTLKAEGLGVSREALDYLAANLGGDRLVTRAELQKLALYKGPGEGGPEEGGPGEGRIELADAQACVGDTAEVTLEDIAFATGGGDIAALERAFQRAIHEGAQPVQPLRAASRHFQRLHAVSDAENLDNAMGKLRPPVFWKRKDAFRGQAQAWDQGQLARALERLLEAENRTKTTGLPATAIASRALMEIAHRSPLRKRRRPARR